VITVNKHNLTLTSKYLIILWELHQKRSQRASREKLPRLIKKRRKKRIRKQARIKLTFIKPDIASEGGLVRKYRIYRKRGKRYRVGLSPATSKALFVSDYDASSGRSIMWYALLCGSEFATFFQ
jgi:hypothetical protein